MPASTNPICGILPNVISGKRIPELDDDMLADEDDAAAVEIERAAASVKQSRMRHEIKMVPVAGEGEELRPLLSDLIPEVIGVRCSYSSTSIEQLASVALAFGQDLETHRDPRLRVVERAQLRGHRADRIEPPLACLVRTHARLVTLAALAPEWWGQVHQLNVKPVGSYYIDLPGQLPREPEPATHQLSAESLARCRQVFEDMTEEEARGLYRPMSDRRFDQTTAQLVNVDAVLYRMPQGSSAIMWIKYGELLWPVALIRGAPLTKVPPPDVDRVREWNTRRNPQIV